MSGKIPPLPEVEKLSPNVIRILGSNPSKFTLQGTNTYLIGNGPKRILLDTGEGKPQWFETLQKVLSNEGATLDTVLVSHWHPDHIGGVKDVKTLSPPPKVYKNSDYASDEEFLNITDGQKFSVDGATLRAFHTPGHTTDHMAMVFEEEDALFTADNILGHGTAVFEDLPAYIDSLSKMSKAVSGRGYPGHGAVIENVQAKAAEYIAHRAQREQEVVNVMRKTGKDGLTLMEMVKVIYKDVPENLHIPASRGVLQILWKLQEEGKVECEDRPDEEVWRLSDKASL
jgi:glyoxylase-like metal-dependent hydrolase (beta-lactamase superfamily II)